METNRPVTPHRRAIGSRRKFPVCSHQKRMSKECFVVVGGEHAPWSHSAEINIMVDMAPRIRFERTTFPLGGGRSIQLSYRGGDTQTRDCRIAAGWRIDRLRDALQSASDHNLGIVNPMLIAMTRVSSASP